MLCCRGPVAKNLDGSFVRAGVWEMRLQSQCLTMKMGKIKMQTDGIADGISKR